MSKYIKLYELVKEDIVSKKECKKCWEIFPISSSDINFYKKIDVPEPEFCPDCRKQLLLSFRNERKFYRSKCDLCDKPIITIYDPAKGYKVYCNDCWWSDKWDPQDYAVEFDFSKPFFEQFEQLLKNTPLLALHMTNSETSKFCNYVWDMNKCYMVWWGWACDNVLYSSKALNSENCVDCLDIVECRNCYNCVNCENVTGGFYCRSCYNSSNIYFSTNLTNCEECIGCYNLQNKKYCINNKQYSKDEYFKLKEEILKQHLSSQDFSNLPKDYIEKAYNVLNCEQSRWDNLKDCKQAVYVFNSSNIQNWKFLENGKDAQDIYDWYGYWYNQSLGYQFIDTWVDGYKQFFTVVCHNSAEVYYSFLVYGSKNIFGSVWIKNWQYYILNKKYSREEYEIMKNKIIEHMKKTWEWWQFFPAYLSPFGYNETIAMDYYPLDKQQAIRQWFNWNDNDYSVDVPKGINIIDANDLPEDISELTEDIKNKILNSAIRCIKTGKLYRIIKPELDFYIKNNLPLPKYHPDVRYKNRLAIRVPRTINVRNCDKCWKEMLSVYSEDVEFKVYCQECYDREFI